MLRFLFLLALALTLAACAEDIETPVGTFPADTARVAAVPTASLPPDAEGPLVVYTSQEARIAEPLVARFREATGLDVQIRYVDDAALVAQLQTEGDRTPADVVWTATAGPLAALAEADLFTILPDSFRVLPGAFVPTEGEWMPVSVRFRGLAYAPTRVDSAALPASVTELAEWEGGRIGWAPTSAAFRDALTAYWLQGGEDAARDWLRAMDDRATAVPADSLLVEALLAEEIDLALTDHTHALRDSSGLAFAVFAPGDAGNAAVVSGAGVLDTSPRQRAARRFVGFLLSRGVQAFLAQSVAEVPVVAGVAPPARFVPLAAALEIAPRLDVERFGDLEATFDLLRAAGLLPSEDA